MKKAAKSQTREIRMRAYADVGSHGGLVEFWTGPVARKYPGLLHLYRRKLPGLVPVTITYRRRRKDEAA